MNSMTHTTTTPLTPIDTGEVAEPHVWRTRRPDCIGCVDFDNEESATLATVRMVRTESGDYELIVVPLMLDAEGITVTIRDEI